LIIAAQARAYRKQKSAINQEKEGIFSSFALSYLIMITCYVALGGNKRQTLTVMERALISLSATDGIRNVETSRLYRTSAVSDLPQEDYLNAVARFHCSLPLPLLWGTLTTLEKSLGKEVKAKNSPRLIDLDLLFYDSLRYQDEQLTLPHPRWQERLFVLTPLLDLTSELFFEEKTVIDLFKLISLFPNPNHERVMPLDHTLPFQKVHR